MISLSTYSGLFDDDNTRSCQADTLTLLALTTTTALCGSPGFVCSRIMRQLGLNVFYLVRAVPLFSLYRCVDSLIGARTVKTTQGHTRCLGIFALVSSVLC